MGSSKNQTTRQNIELSPAAREALTVELGEFFNRIRPSEQAMTRQLAGAIGAARRPRAERGVLASNAMRALNLPMPAVQSAAQGAGTTPRQLSEVMRGLGELEPTSLSQLQELGFNVARGTDSVIDPRFQFALTPEIETETSQGPGATALQALQAALSIAGTAALFSST